MELSLLNNRDSCIKNAMDIVGSKWTALILSELTGGPLRFCALERAIPDLNPRTLSRRLDELESHDVVSRCGENGYELTPKGRDLIPVLENMAAWGAKYS